MKLFICTLLFLSGITSFSQNSTHSIRKNILKLEQALIQKDTILLKELLHEKLSLGHSNGWIEDQKSLLKDLQKGKVSYSEFKATSELDFAYLSETTITTRRSVLAVGIVNESAFSVHLNILEVWIKTDEGWLLLARQSVNQKPN